MMKKVKTISKICSTFVLTSIMIIIFIKRGKKITKMVICFELTTLKIINIRSIIFVQIFILKFRDPNLNSDTFSWF